ncbi:MAG: CDP-diacylglycerol--glycerol-3-phosphate 3-phosphatidyltransferase [Firmicutes bacterium]|nr:CDP-diacylglycerol--glycerol-3-phosphate 3-phosphatidyltransferase [Bacillota bacterium]
MNNLANKITIFRIFLAPLFMIPILVKVPYGEFIAALVFVIAASTDGLDGYIARKHKMVTNFGKFLDPLADKLLVTSALITLAWMQQIHPLPVFVILSREFAVTGLRVIAASEGHVISASKLGKFKTLTQIIAITALTINAGMDKSLSWLHTALGFLPVLEIAMISLYLAIIMTIVSGVDYFVKNKHVIHLG